MGCAPQCRSRGCRNCDGKHHTSICERMKSTTGQLQDPRVEKSISALMCHASTLHPTVQAKIGTETVRIMFDSGAGSSYLCTDGITKLNLKPTRKENRASSKCSELLGGTWKFTASQYSHPLLKYFTKICLISFEHQCNCYLCK